MYIEPVSSLNGSLCVPGDKSISHRSIMLASLAEGPTTIRHFLMSKDCLSTISCFRALGISITIEEDKITVYGKGLHGLSASKDALNCGNSGTTMRLLCGILSGQSFSSILTGDNSLSQRPMHRIIEPLSQMGAHIKGELNNFCPLEISPSILQGINYEMPIASAQVKSAILLSGLYADRPTTVIEPQSSRDHTERLLLSFGAYLIRSGKKITVFPKPELKGQALTIPGDISSAAFFIVAALIVPNSSLTLYHVGINPTRRGVINVLLQMGANISLSNERLICGEPVCDIHVSSSKLSGITISGEIIPSLIDEIPILTVAACFASGTTIIKDAAELKFKESNRIEAISTELKKMGAAVTSTDDGLIIEGEQTLYGAKLETYNDHRIAMSLAIAALAAHSSSIILDDECIDISFPNFTNLLNTLK